MLDKHEEVHIFMAKKGQKQRRYSPEFKLSVIMDMRENKLSYRETVLKYLLGSGQAGGPIDMIQRWEKWYDEFGFEGLAKRKPGWVTKMDNPNKGRPKKKKKIVEGSPNELEQLRERVYYLEAENEYLKKLDALIREKEARAAARKKK